MRFSTILALLGAAVVIATPLQHLAMHNKKALVTNIVTEVVVVTVTAGVATTTSSSSSSSSSSMSTTVPFAKYTPRRRKSKSKSSAAPTPSQAPPPPPPPAPTPSSSSSAAAPPPPPPPPPPAATPTYEPGPTPSPPAPAPPANADATKPTDYKSTALYHHDKHRANHTAGSMLWSDTLEQYAKTIATRCIFAHDMTQGGGGYGQNLAAYGTTADMSSINLANVVADAITNQWYYGEASNMPYGQDNPAVTNVPEYLHFSQLLWKSSTQVGCYTAQCGAGTIFAYHSLYTVCNYAKTGNVLGSFASEVTKPIGLAGITAKIA